MIISGNFESARMPTVPHRISWASVALQDILYFTFMS